MVLDRFYSRYPLKRLRVLGIAILLLFSITLTSCSPAAQSANGDADAELEAKVLQIIRDNPEVIIESVQAYQQQQQQALTSGQQEFLQGMKANPQSVIADSPTTGAKNGEVVLLEFSDFQCPFCAKAQTNLKKFMDAHKGKVTLAFKHLPLSRIHPEAIAAAQAAWAAQQQEKFWEYHDALFAQQDRLGEELYLAIAEDLDLDLEKFNGDRESEAAIAALESDIQMARTIGVSGTPFFVMNGETLSGAVELSDLEQVLAKVS
ncbi:MAG: DsbA family protein [Cyanobacteriota bacterium]|nr:DsbA family protein [Cyanobacteriota bacterium]